MLVRERFTPPKAGAGKADDLIQSFAILSRSPGLLPLFVVLLLAQFGVQAVQPVVTLYVQGSGSDRWRRLATLGGLAFSVTGVADLIASPFLGRRSDVLGYRRVLMIALGGRGPGKRAAGVRAELLEFRRLRGLRSDCSWEAFCRPPMRWWGGSRPAGDRGTVYGVTASAMFLGQSLGPLSGGAIAATLGLRWVFLITATLLTINLVWVWVKVPEVR